MNVQLVIEPFSIEVIYWPRTQPMIAQSVTHFPPDESQASHDHGTEEEKRRRKGTLVSVSYRIPSRRSCPLR